MTLLAFYSVWAVLLELAVAFGPVPRITWEHREVQLVHFHEPGVSNYSTLLLSEDRDVLYVGAREVIFALNAVNIAEKQHELHWKVTEDKRTKCAVKGKSEQVCSFIEFGGRLTFSLRRSDDKEESSKYLKLKSSKHLKYLIN